MITPLANIRIPICTNWIGSNLFAFVRTGNRHFEKSFPPFWRGDDCKKNCTSMFLFNMLLLLCSNIILFWFTILVFERLFTDKTLAETLKQQQEWVKSHRCTRCGLFYDISCDCQRVRGIDLDEIRPSLFNYGSERPYLMRAKVSLLISSMFIFLKK